jgi:hypothetical protein
VDERGGGREDLPLASAQGIEGARGHERPGGSFGVGGVGVGISQVGHEAIAEVIGGQPTHVLGVDGLALPHIEARGVRVDVMDVEGGDHLLTTEDILVLGQ